MFKAMTVVSVVLFFYSCKSINNQAALNTGLSREQLASYNLDGKVVRQPFCALLPPPPVMHDYRSDQGEQITWFDAPGDRDTCFLLSQAGQPIAHAFFTRVDPSGGVLPRGVLIPQLLQYARDNKLNAHVRHGKRNVSNIRWQDKQVPALEIIAIAIGPSPLFLRRFTRDDNNTTPTLDVASDGTLIYSDGHIDSDTFIYKYESLEQQSANLQSLLQVFAERNGKTTVAINALNTVMPAGAQKVASEFAPLFTRDMKERLEFIQIAEAAYYQKLDRSSLLDEYIELSPNKYDLHLYRYKVRQNYAQRLLSSFARTIGAKYDPQSLTNTTNAIYTKLQEWSAERQRLNQAGSSTDADQHPNP